MRNYEDQAQRRARKVADIKAKFTTLWAEENKKPKEEQVGVMAQQGFVSKRLRGSGPRGFLVIENQVNSSTALALAQMIRAQEMADKADKGQEVF